MTKINALELSEAEYRSALAHIDATGRPPDASIAPVTAKAKSAMALSDKDFRAALATITMTGKVPVEQGAKK